MSSKTTALVHVTPLQDLHFLVIFQLYLLLFYYSHFVNFCLFFFLVFVSSAYSCPLLMSFHSSSSCLLFFSSYTPSVSILSASTCPSTLHNLSHFYLYVILLILFLLHFNRVQGKYLVRYWVVRRAWTNIL